MYLRELYVVKHNVAYNHWVFSIRKLRFKPNTTQDIVAIP